MPGAGAAAPASEANNTQSRQLAFTAAEAVGGWPGKARPWWNLN